MNLFYIMGIKAFFGGLLRRVSMKKFLVAILMVAVVYGFGAERYMDRMFDVSVNKDVVYASGVSHLKTLNNISLALLSYSILGDAGTSVYLYANETDLTTVDLHMDIYSPKGDTETNRPAVVVAHGGAFAAGDKDDMDQQSVTYCDSLAARGYVTACIEYRLGITMTTSNMVLTIDSLDFSRTVYRGIQDVRAAIRYLRANAKKLGINPNRIYIVGNSAGGILALENLYLDKSSEIPAVAKNAPDLGGLDAYGVQGYPAEANAAVALWGAVHDINIIEDNAKPVLLVHGKADSTVLFKTGRPLRDIAGILQKAMPEELAEIGAKGMNINTPTLYGSFVIDSVLKERGVAHETYFLDAMPHELYDYDDFDVKVQKKVFDFLYARTQAPETESVKPIVLARASAIRMGEGNMNFTVNRGKNLAYLVLDIRGKAQMSGSVSAGQTVDLSALKNGVYVLRVQGERPIRFGLRH